MSIPPVGGGCIDARALVEVAERYELTCAERAMCLDVAANTSPATGRWNGVTKHAWARSLQITYRRLAAALDRLDTLGLMRFAFAAAQTGWVEPVGPLAAAIQGRPSTYLRASAREVGGAPASSVLQRAELGATGLSGDRRSAQLRALAREVDVPARQSARQRAELSAPAREEAADTRRRGAASRPEPPQLPIFARPGTDLPAPTREVPAQTRSLIDDDSSTSSITTLDLVFERLAPAVRSAMRQRLTTPVRASLVAQLDDAAAVAGPRRVAEAVAASISADAATIRNPIGLLRSRIADVLGRAAEIGADPDDDPHAGAARYGWRFAGLVAASEFTAQTAEEMLRSEFRSDPSAADRAVQALYDRLDVEAGPMSTTA